MRSLKRVNVVLFEILVVILFFALSAVVILKLYAKGYEISDQSRDQTNALVIAQDWAERIYAQAGDPLQGWQKDDLGGYTMYMDEDMQPCLQHECQYRVYISSGMREVSAGIMLESEISVYVRDQRLVTLPVAHYVSGEESA